MLSDDWMQKWGRLHKSEDQKLFESGMTSA